MKKLILLIIALASTVYGQENELLHVQVIFTHGERSPPLELFSKSLNESKPLPNGVGQLTDIGINQQFQLGQWLRRRYKNLLNKKYDYEEIFVRSTDQDITLMSAQSNLAGLYYDKDNFMIPDVKWRPIPIHIIPRQSSIIMLQRNCESYNIKKDEMYYNKKFYSQLQYFQSTLDLMRNITNQPNMQFKDLKNFFYILDYEKVHNITWGSNITEQIYEDLKMINKLDWEIMYHGEELQKLSGGLFLNEIINQLKEISANQSTNKKEKMIIYSGHNTDLAALLSAIGIYNNVKPADASCLVIELWKNSININNSMDHLYVKMYFKNHTDENSINLSEMKLKQCENYQCNLSQFIRSVQSKSLTISQYNIKCFITRYKFFIWAISLIVGFLLLCSILCIICLMSKSNYESFT